MRSNKTITGLEVRFENILIYIFPIVGFIFAFIKKAVADEAKFNYKQTGSIFVIQAAVGILISINASISTSLALNGTYGGTAIFTILNFVLGIIPTILYVFSIITVIKGFMNQKFEIPVINKIGNLIWK